MCGALHLSRSTLSVDLMNMYLINERMFYPWLNFRYPWGIKKNSSHATFFPLLSRKARPENNRSIEAHNLSEPPCIWSCRGHLIAFKIYRENREAGPFILHQSQQYGILGKHCWHSWKLKKRWTPLSQTLEGTGKTAQALVWQYVDEIINCNHIGAPPLYSQTGWGQLVVVARSLCCKWASERFMVNSV